MSTQTGRQAETAVASLLSNQGFTVLAQNWRTRYCEIDVVAEKNSTIYFVEVKYRRNNYQGFGLDYITNKKLKQMLFAAELWSATYQWKGRVELAAIEVSGPNFDIGELRLCV